jgi:PHD and RING finger domain-containing protein 1
MVCEGGAVPSAASKWDGNTGGETENCPICSSAIVTQETATPESCNHNFCTGCLQKWLKYINTCPIDRQVCNAVRPTRG